MSCTEQGMRISPREMREKIGVLKKRNESVVEKLEETKKEMWKCITRQPNDVSFVLKGLERQIQEFEIEISSLAYFAEEPGNDNAVE